MVGKEKFYAVKIGRVPGIYSNWDDASKQVTNYSNATHKSFESREEAEKYMGYNKGSGKDARLYPSETLSAYVDGSFDSGAKCYGSGIVLVQDGNIVEELIISGDNPDFVASYQIPGEVLGVLKAIERAKEKGYEELNVYYDYEGIEKWARGTWKANKAISRYYVSKLDEHIGNFEINFKKVKAHSGNKYNERADQLAKEAINKHLEKINGEGFEKSRLLKKVLSNKISDLFYKRNVNDKEVTNINVVVLDNNKFKITVNSNEDKCMIVNIE